MLAWPVQATQLSKDAILAIQQVLWEILQLLEEEI